MGFVETSRELFGRIADAALAELRQGEELNLRLSAEEQAYVRFNNTHVRQATSVAQRRLGLVFQSAGRKLRLSVDLGGGLRTDLAAVRSLLARARAEAQVLPADPFIVAMANNGTSDNHHGGDYPGAEDWMGQIADAAAGMDFAGLLAAGPQIRAVRNSAGQDHWFCCDSFFIDYSLFTVNGAGENKAVKGLHADRVWRPVTFAHALEAGKSQLERLRRPARSLPPGEYRVYLAPAAVEKLVGMFSWGAVSYDDWKKGNSALQKLIEGEAGFSEQFNLRENFRLGLAPRFNNLGEVGPAELPIIGQGRLENLRVSSRSAQEHGVPGNGADDGEGLRSPEVRGGGLAEAEVLRALDTGLYVGDLHYLNWSDTHTARLTGMTRYACFWVENGEIAAPIRDLRFDESLYRIFGTGLEALTRESQMFPATDTYRRRALGGCKVPGAMIGTFRFTL